MAKVQISINDELLNMVDDYCKENFITRSGFISLLCSQHLQKNEVTKTLVTLRDSLVKVSEGKELSEDELLELDSTLRAVSMITGNK